MDCEDENDMKCGTFVELHAPGDPKVLNEAKLKRGFVSGYRMASISTQYMDEENQIICRGTYELWWVQRIPGSKYRYKEYAKRFQVLDPECDYDYDSNQFSKSANLADTHAIKIADENAGWTEYILLGEEGSGINPNTKIVELLDEHNMFKDESTGEVYEGRSIFFSQTTGMSTFVLPEGAQYRRTREWLTRDVLDSQAGGT